MKKLLLLITAIISVTGGLNANDGLTQTVRGNVTDAVTGYPLIGAYVIPAGPVSRIPNPFSLRRSGIALI